MRATVTGIFAPPTGNTWIDGWIEFVFDSAWSDGSARVSSPVRGILQPSTRDRFVVPGSLAALLVPATPTGAGVIPGPRVAVKWWLKDSAGFEYSPPPADLGILLADASNNWNLNTQILPIQFVDNPGPAPVGLSQAQADARYAQLTLLATTIAAGLVQLATATDSNVTTPPNPTRVLTADNLHGKRHVNGGADAVPRIGDVGGLAVPAAPTLTYLSGQNITLTPRSSITTMGATPDLITFNIPFTRVVATIGQWSAHTITPPAGWLVATITGGGYTATQADSLLYADNLVIFANQFVGTITTNVYITLRKT